MRILALSDEECHAYWDYYIPGRLDEFDLIISCGDLKAEYLSFIVTMGKAPVLYVHGNHDESYDMFPPEGCDCIDDRLVVYNGVRLLGLGGCMRYHPGNYQYTEAQMRKRIHKLKSAIKKAGGVDIVVTHTPPRGLGDGEDPAHIGFQELRSFIETYHPRYLLHGHVHLRFNSKIPRQQQYGETEIINVSDRYVLDLTDVEVTSRNFEELHWIK